MKMYQGSLVICIKGKAWFHYATLNAVYATGRGFTMILSPPEVICVRDIVAFTSRKV
jgi:hypothetical protein